MEQSFLLKHYGHLSIDEQMMMTAEDRVWWLQRIDEENRKEKETARKNVPSNKIPPVPGQPPK